MRRYVSMFVCALSALFLFGCGGMWTMKDASEKPSPRPSAEKATLVIMRTTSFGFAVAIDNYLDGKIIGQTRGKCYFITEIEPGEHLLTARSENMRTHKINFEAGKVYYLQQAIYMGMWKGRTEYDTLNPVIFEQQKPECSFLVFDKSEADGNKDGVIDLTEAMKKREEEMAEEAEYYSKVDGVKGF